MNLYYYVRVEVGKADPARYTTLSGLMEEITGNPSPDIIPHTDPGAIKFRHVKILAENEDEAYDIGHKHLPEIEKGSVANDYVIPA